MSYVIAGRAIKNEYLSLGVIFSAIGVGLLASRGGDKTDASKPQSLVEKAKASVPLNAGSSEEEQLMDSIKNFIAEAEKDAKH